MAAMLCPLCEGGRWLDHDGQRGPEIDVELAAIHRATDLTEQLARHLVTMEPLEQERAVRYLLALLDELGGADGRVALRGVARALTGHLSASAVLVDWG